MKVVRINPLQASSTNKTAAFFDIQTAEGIVIKGFKLINGTHGLFIAPPNQKGKDGKYYDSVVIPKEAVEGLQKAVIEEYNKAS
ncbi:MAG: hypothetical protein FD143_1724 [Ignavibacteria bacterium]|nr:MAG: hypothetical protein FD143_1724 [Ignavibacteria bacterium]KAF0160072.1 MAG: hypothetical protein FD188_1886 [Ignavibacteria bacterium]